ncbi:hypothetical protein F511_02746 [Dorcoceras hygrometricum]|uniref:SLH domain-containing protein n=1 Tax=Dorcoceras hygrometricum TaxID=472368 RepID=A0A2Z7DJC2_9LAMI|nr:hypothetical protein F511_02746 [Dorcoceras hygrometricum]
MNALITSTAFCPCSFQLKYAFNRQKSPSVFLRSRFSELDRRRVNLVWVVVRSSGLNGYGLGRCRTQVYSWMNSNPSSEEFSGWSNADAGLQTASPRPKKSLVGMLGAGAAGILLVAGLTFTALSISNRTTSRMKQQMEPLTSQQEESLTSDNHRDSFGGERNGEKVEILRTENEENITGTDKDLPLHKENSEANESSNSDDVGAGQSEEVVDLINIDSNKNVSQEGSALNGDLVSVEADDSLVAENIQTENGSPANENTNEPKSGGHVDGSLAAESTSVSKSDNHVDAKILVPSELDSRPENVMSDYPNKLSSPVESQVDDFVEVNSIPEECEEFISLPSTGDVEMGNKLLTVDTDSCKILGVSVDGDDKDLENMNGIASAGLSLVPEIANQFGNEPHDTDYNDIDVNRSFFDSSNPGNFFTSAGIPAPSVVSAALQAPPGKVLVPAVVDQLQTLALSALKDLKVIKDDVRPGDLCTRREYARWLVVASSILSRSTASKVYPAMYIENVSELAFDDITPDDPDFPSIQGLAEAGLIASKLSRHDMQSSVDESASPLLFSPDRSAHFSQPTVILLKDLVSWKLALENRQLPVVDRKTLQQLSGFIDIDKIDQDAWPALVADLAVGEQGIITLAFGYTRLFQPGKPVTKAQAAMALSTGDAATMVSEELARIEAEAMAENAVAAHNALIAQVEKDLNARYEKELLQEKEKNDAVQKLAEEARREVELLRAEREERNLALMKERAAVDSEIEILSRLRREVDEQLHTLTSDRVEVTYEKERLSKLRRDAETENQEIARLQYELEVERKALSMARAWAEDEMKRAREQAKALEEARNRWEIQGIKVVVDDDLREEEDTGVTWLDSGKQYSVEGTTERPENLVDKLRTMAGQVSGKCKNTINKIIEQIVSFISILKEKALKVGKQAGELKNTAKSKLNVSLQGMQRGSAEYTSSVSEGAKRIAGDWKDGVERLSQKFKA